MYWDEEKTNHVGCERDTNEEDGEGLKQKNKKLLTPVSPETKKHKKLLTPVSPATKTGIISFCVFRPAFGCCAHPKAGFGTYLFG